MTLTIEPEATWNTQTALSDGTAEQKPNTSAPQRPPDIYACLRTILGYDPRQAGALAEGYTTMAAEDLDLAESNAAASFETLPEDE